MDETKLSGWIISKKYGADVQMYYRRDGDITYFACYTDPNWLDKNGRAKRRRIQIGKKSEGVTQQYNKMKRDEMVLKLKHGELPQSFKKHMSYSYTTFEMLANSYFEERLAKNNFLENIKNVNNDRSIFRNHLQGFIYREASNIKDEDVEDLKNNLRQVKGLSEKTTNNVLTVLSSILNFGIEKRLVTFKPIIKKIREIDNERQKYFSHHEIKLILDNLQHDKYLYLFVSISLSTGGRLETIREIKIQDIDLNTNSISLIDLKRQSAGKNNPRYIGFINHDLKNLMPSIMRGKSPNDYLLADELGNRVSRDYIQNNLQKLFDRLFNQGLDKSDRKYRAVIHTLRHTFASQLAINGVDIYKIQKLMNHSDIKMTNRYAKLTPSFGMDAVNLLNFWR